MKKRTEEQERKAARKNKKGREIGKKERNEIQIEEGGFNFSYCTKKEDKNRN